jgi:hypothetical protein
MWVFLSTELAAALSVALLVFKRRIQVRALEGRDQ